MCKQSSQCCVLQVETNQRSNWNRNVPLCQLGQAMRGTSWRTGVDPERDAAHARSHAHDHTSRRMIRTAFACTHTPQHARGCDSRCLRCGRVQACMHALQRMYKDILKYMRTQICLRACVNTHTSTFPQRPCSSRHACMHRFVAQRCRQISPAS